MKCLVKKLWILLTIVFMILVATGCWNRRELKELGVLGAAAVDSDEENIMMTFELVKPRKLDGGKQAEEPVVYFQGKGKSMFEAARNATLQVKQKLYWSHVNMYYFSEDAGKEGILKYLDYFNRNHEHRRYVNMAVSKGSPAYKVTGFEGVKEDVPSSYIEELFQNYKSNGKAVSIKVLDFLKDYYAEGIEPVLGVVQITKRTDTGLKELQKESDELIPSCEGAAVFRDDKLIGFLDGIQTRSYNFLTGKVKSGILVSNSHDNKGINSIEIIKSSCDLNIEIREGKYYASATVEINGMLGEETGEGNLSSLTAISSIENNTSIALEKELQDTIIKVQNLKSDIFGFGHLIHKKYPKEWKKIKGNWNEIFSGIDIDVSVYTHVQRVGGATQPLAQKEKN